MWSVCSSLQLHLVPPWKHKIKLLNHASKSTRFINFPPFLRITTSFSKDNDSPATTDPNQLGYDPSEELFGLDVDMPPRDVKSDVLEPKSWFGPNGQYIKELPCPSCRGRGYTPCTKCGIERSRQDCSLCNGKGIMSCQHCLGECVIWEESIDENPWEKARSISPLKVKEDDEVDNLELNLNARKKTKRVYRSTPPEVGLKISRSLKSLNAKTGLFSNRMKIIHQDPSLHAQRVAAIKKAKGTDASRKHTSETLKKFFSDPENRRKRSISMKGVRFFCKNCGLEGHRSSYCPARVENTDRRFKCGLCGGKGHNRRTCGKPRTIIVKKRIVGKYHCRICGKDGHNRRTCSLKTELQSDGDTYVRGGYLESSNGHVQKHLRRCSICGKVGHNRKTCILKTQQNSADHDDSGFLENSKGAYRGLLEDSKEKYRGILKDSKVRFGYIHGESEGHVHKHHHCSICRKVGHNRRTCSLKTELQSPSTAPKSRGSHDDAKGGYVGSCEVLKGEYRGSLEDPKGEYGGSLEVKKGQHEGSLEGSKDRGSLKNAEGEYRGSLEDSKDFYDGFLKDSNIISRKHHHHCSLCGKVGHNRRTCSLKSELGIDSMASEDRDSLEDSQGEYRSSPENGDSFEGSEGEYRGSLEDSRGKYRGYVEDFKQENRASLEYSKGLFKGSLEDSNAICHKHHHHCSLCGKVGHNRRTCSLKTELLSGKKGSLEDLNWRTYSESTLNSSISKRVRSYHCRICGVNGHNRRTCVKKGGASSVNSEDAADVCPSF